MQYYLVLSLGFFAQILFASRMIIQWIDSERAGRVISPTLFWQTSLLASFLFIIYGILRHDVVIIAGQLLSYFIYIRNLQLKNEWQQFSIVLRGLILILPFISFLSFFYFHDSLFANLVAKNNFSHPLMIAGAAGQLLLNLRFVYQWYLSEKFRHSFFPLGFWVISVFGSVLVITYALHRHDPVLLVAQSLGFVIYSRNIMLGKRHGID